MPRALRLALLTASLATSSLAQPRLGPVVEVRPSAQTEPLAFFNFGTSLTTAPLTYVLTWQDDRSGFTQLWAAMVDSNGTVLVPGTRLLVDHRDLADVSGAVGCSRPGGNFVFSVDSDTRATGLLVTDSSLRRQRFEAVPVQAASTALDCGNTPTLWAYSEIDYPSGPTAHFGLKVFGYDLNAGLVELDGGNPLVADLNVLTSDGIGPTFARAGVAGTTMLVWSGNPDAGPDDFDVFGAFISNTDVGPPFLVAGGPGPQKNARVAWNGGSSFFVVYEDGLAPVRDLGVARVSTVTGLSTAGPPQAFTAEDEYAPALAFTNTFIAGAWLSGAPKPDALWVDVVPPSVSPPLLLRSGYVDEPHVGSARDGQLFVQYRDFSRGIRAVGQFVVLPDAGSVIDPSVTVRAQLEPLVLGAEAGPLITWRESGAHLAFATGTDAGATLPEGERGTRLGGDARGLALITVGDVTEGMQVDDRTLRTSTPVTFPGLISHQASTPRYTTRGFVFASTRELGPADNEINLDQLLLDGGVGRHLRIAYNQPEVFNLDVAPAESIDTIGVTWSEHHLVHAQCIRGLDGMGTLLPINTVNTAHYEARTRIATSGQDFFVTWVSERATPPYTPLVMGQRLDSNCQNVGPALVLGEMVDPWNTWPAVTFDGLQYVVVWVTNADVMGDLVGARVRNGAVTGPFPVVTAADTDFEPSLIAFGPGHWGVAYTHFFPAENVSARRVFFRTIDDRANGTTCENAGQCESGVCSDGVCCNRACNSAADSCETCAETGECRAKSQGDVCRPSGAACDAAEVCDGASVSCPPDTSGMTCTLCSATAEVFAVSCGVNFTLPQNEVPVPAGGGVTTYGLRTCDASALPNGLTISPTTGVVTWNQPPEATATVRVLLVAQGPSDSATNTVQLELTCAPDGGVVMNDAGTSGAPKPRTLSVGCGCESGSASVWMWVVVLLWRRRARWRG